MSKKNVDNKFEAVLVIEATDNGEVRVTVNRTKYDYSTSLGMCLADIIRGYAGTSIESVELIDKREGFN